jgi:cyanophycinase-like exopeptidase
LEIAVSDYEDILKKTQRRLRIKTTRETGAAISKASEPAPKFKGGTVRRLPDAAMVAAAARDAERARIAAEKADEEEVARRRERDARIAAYEKIGAEGISVVINESPDPIRQLLAEE